ncbi:MAG: DUF2817 domain-containing protein [Saprospirales bacterium]|nr:MAG: DUF2817 domain-containing protein [Saprospirales bacterium]
MGKNSLVKIYVGKLPSGNKIYINSTVFRSEKKGPVVLLLAGMHGDEIDGVEILRQFLRNFAPVTLKRGSLIVIPLLNIFGFLHISRDVPDGKDVNRSFPGSKFGSLASRVASSLTTHILPQADIILDFHTGGTGKYNFPQIRYSNGDIESQELGKVFNAPFLISKPIIAKSLRKVVNKAGKPILVYEAGEAQRRDEHAINLGLRGISRVLAHLDMINFEDQTEFPIIHLSGSGWRRASQAGFFIPLKKSGDPVKKGEVLGKIQDLADPIEYPVKSLRDGFVIGNSFSSIVYQGDALYHIGYY